MLSVIISSLYAFGAPTSSLQHVYKKTVPVQREHFQFSSARVRNLAGRFEEMNKILKLCAEVNRLANE